MTDPTLQSRQRREKLLTALGLLKTRYESLFHEPATPRLQSWLAAKIEEEKTQTIKASLSHFETDEILELLAIVEESKEPFGTEDLISSAQRFVAEREKNFGVGHAYVVSVVGREYVKLLVKTCEAAGFKCEFKEINGGVFELTVHRKPTPEQKQNDEAAKRLTQIMSKPKSTKKVKFGSKT